MQDLFSHGLEQILGRASGPMHFRLLIMPATATFIAIRAGLSDARAGQPAFLWTFVTDPADRRRLFRAGIKDIGRVFVFALVLDTTYQLAVLHEFHAVQLLIVAVGCAIVPYVLIRGPVTRLASRWYDKKDSGS